METTQEFLMQKNWKRDQMSNSQIAELNFTPEIMTVIKSEINISDYEAIGNYSYRKSRRTVEAVIQGRRKNNEILYTALMVAKHKLTQKLEIINSFCNIV